MLMARAVSLATGTATDCGRCWAPSAGSVPRARLDATEGRTTEWKSTALRAYQRRTKQADSG